jgi:hypothetical protein
MVLWQEELNETPEAKEVVKVKLGREYKALAVWHRMTGSRQYYIDDQQARAAATKAPLDALYEVIEAGGNRTGKWRCMSDLPPDHHFHQYFEMRKEEA